ncbi:uncharacterized protein LOC103137525 isoform X1 [Poecilia formosa]|uniref:uncharacterized protein LOC103137525 isoform X1 n=1 Tax=Poecilia formosa TaxID=48698 RepID=UPI000443F5DA|nr:PREDICTED: uncharacterized protein LOC103137525 isoform X1 [Poecilia formosa]XP_016526586.1 PREDICTED: uncharacterized protein LOC103137525 isoform X1 [Poecilia formosa]
MSGSCVLFSRLFVGMCAAVILIVMCSHADRASPAVPIIPKRVKYSVLRRLSPEQQIPSLAGRQGEDRQVQTPADAPSISNHHSHPIHFTQGSFSYSQNSLDKARPRVKITRLLRGGMMRPASIIFTSHSPYKGPGSEGGIPITPLSKVDEDRSARKLNSVFPSQTGGLQSAQLLTQRGLGSDFLETNQLLMVRVQSSASGIQPKNVLDFTNQAWGGAQSLGNSLSVIKRNPGQERLTSISKFPQNQNSVSSREMLEHNNIQSYLVKDSPAQTYTVTNVEQKAFRGQRNTADWAQKQSLSGMQEKSKFISNFNHYTRTGPNEEESEAHIGFGRPRVIFYPTPHKAAASTPGFLHPFSLHRVSEDKKQKNLVSAVHSQDGRRAFGLLDQVNVTSREPRQEYAASWSVKRFNRLDGLTNPERKPAKETSGPSSADRTQSTLDKGVDIGFKFSNAYPSLSQKYSFGQRRAATTTPAKLGMVKTSPPSPVTQVSSTTTVQIFTTTPKSQQPESGASMNRNENRFRLYRERFGLEGYGSQPLEGAKALPQSADSPVKPKPSFKGFELRSSEVSRPKPIRIYRLYSQRDDREPGSSGDFKMPPNIARADGSISRFTSNKTQILQSFLPSKNRTVGTRSSTSWISPMVSSSYLSSLEQSTEELEPKVADGNKSAAEEVPEFKTLTSRTVRGKRVKLTQTGGRRLLGPIAINSTGNSVIRRLPRVKAVTFEDVLGNASFSSVMSPVHHQGRFPNVTTALGEGWSSKSDDVKNTSGSPKANVTNEETESVYRKEEADDEVGTSDLFFESEGSGSLDLSDVLSIASENEPAGNDLLELDYLRKSTGNVSFKSLGKSHLEQR